MENAATKKEPTMALIMARMKKLEGKLEPKKAKKSSAKKPPSKKSIHDLRQKYLNANTAQAPSGFAPEAGILGVAAAQGFSSPVGQDEQDRLLNGFDRLGLDEMAVEEGDEEGEEGEGDEEKEEEEDMEEERGGSSRRKKRRTNKKMSKAKKGSKRKSSRRRTSKKTKR